MDSFNGNGNSSQQSNSSNMDFSENNFNNSNSSDGQYNQYSMWGAPPPPPGFHQNGLLSTTTTGYDTLSSLLHHSSLTDPGPNSIRSLVRYQNNQNNGFSSLNTVSQYGSLLSSTNTGSSFISPSVSTSEEEDLDYDKTLNLLRYFEELLATPSAIVLDAPAIEALVKHLKKHLRLVTPPSSPSTSGFLTSSSFSSSPTDYLTSSPFSSPTDYLTSSPYSSNNNNRFRAANNVVKCSSSAFQRRLDEEPMLWVGSLPNRNDYGESTVYSPKVFVGGLPQDITAKEITDEFQNFGSNGNFHIELPQEKVASSGKRHCYLIFSDTEKVKILLSKCQKVQDLYTTTWHYFTTSGYKIEIIPWVTKDNHWPSMKSHEKESNSNQYNVFVGGVYGKLTGEHLAIIFDSLFGPRAISYISIDTDRWKYPRGSARITFNEKPPHSKAIQAHYIEVKANYIENKASGFMKTLEINPYIQENAVCAICKRKPDYGSCGYCKDCEDTFCPTCLKMHHNGHQVIQRSSTKSSRSGSRENSFCMNTSPKRF